MAIKISGNTVINDQQEIVNINKLTVNGGTVGVGDAASGEIGIRIANSALTGTSQYGAYSLIAGSTAGTSSVGGFLSSVATAAESYTVSDVIGFDANNVTKGIGSTITNQHGVRVGDQTQGTNNFGITSLVSSGTNKWNIYASGSANNAFAGNVRVGSTTAPSTTLDVTGTIRASVNIAAPTVSASNGIFSNNSYITENTTVASYTNAWSAGPITINNGVTVTVNENAVWVVA